MGRCSRDRCMKRGGFAAKGIIGAYCKLHAEHGMVSIENRLCVHTSCKKQSSFNVEGSKTPAYCKQHAQISMVNVRSKRCSYDTCMKRPNFNVEGSKTAGYCKQHASDDMADIINRRCTHDTCMKRPSFNVEGSKTAVYCKKHAGDNMMDIINRRCSHDTCTRTPIWGLLASSMATVCSKHKNEVLVGQLVSFHVRCQVVNCCRASRWGLSGKQPTHCHQHGPSQDGFVCVGQAPASKRARRSLSNRSVNPPRVDVKAECMF